MHPTHSSRPRPSTPLKLAAVARTRPMRHGCALAPELNTLLLSMRLSPSLKGVTGSERLLRIGGGGLVVVVGHGELERGLLRYRLRLVAQLLIALGDHQPIAQVEAWLDALGELEVGERLVDVPAGGEAKMAAASLRIVHERRRPPKPQSERVREVASSGLSSAAFQCRAPRPTW